jgi:prefoldin alpha subunit
MNNQQAQIDAEIDHLAESYKDLQDAKQKFKESRDAITIQRTLPNDKSILVPLTSSMYVPGHISNTQQYLINIGTQYLVEKDADGAIDYFDRKMKFIDEQLAKLTNLLQSKRLDNSQS